MNKNKFRAWDKKSKKMREVCSIVYWTAVDATAQKHGQIKLVNLVGRNCIEQKDILVKREEGEFDLMQFTGLTDKNGIEIFEGDVFKVTKHRDTFFEIKYASEMKEDNHEFFGACFYMECELGAIPFDEFALEHGQAIGNIYQNPKLLEL